MTRTTNRRPKGVDVDKPNWFTKLRLRRWFRRTAKAEVRNEETE